MDLHTDSSSRAAEYIHTCAQALKKIIMQLCERNTSKTIEKLPEVRHDDGSGAKNDDTELISSSDQSSLKFSDIIGNTAAKQALFENVVLPLTVSLSTASAIFSGIFLQRLIYVYSPLPARDSQWIRKCLIAWSSRHWQDHSCTGY